MHGIGLHCQEILLIYSRSHEMDSISSENKVPGVRIIHFKTRPGPDAINTTHRPPVIE